MTFEALYVEPVVTLFKRNGGRAWRDSDRHLQLMVELKSETGPTLRAVAEVLGRWPEVFDPAVNPDAVRVTVTGRFPSLRISAITRLTSVSTGRGTRSTRPGSWSA